MKKLALVTILLLILSPVVASAGTLIKSTDSSDVFYLQNQNKYLLPDEKVFFSWFEGFENVVEVGPELLSSFDTQKQAFPSPVNTLIKKRKGNKVYLPVNRGYTLRWLKNEQIAKEIIGLNWSNRIVELSEDEFSNYCIGEPINNYNYSPTRDFAPDLAVYMKNFDSDCKQDEKNKKDKKKTKEKSKNKKEESLKKEEKYREENQIQKEEKLESEEIETEKKEEKENRSENTTKEPDNQQSRDETQNQEDSDKNKELQKEQTNDEVNEEENISSDKDTQEDTNSIKLPDEDTRSLWIWSKADEIVENKGERDKFFEFIKAPHGDGEAEINRLFFFGGSLDLGKDKQKVAEFIRSAHKKGITVEYLTGHADWVKEGNQQEAISKCQRIIDYNEKVVDSAAFDGIHFDIEPHVLDQWEQNSDSGDDKYNDTFESNYMKIMKECRNEFSSGENNLTIGVDMPTYFSYKAEDLMRKIDTKEGPVDYITVLNYFDTTEKFINGYGSADFGGVKHNLRLIDHLPVTFGAETQKDVLDKISFGQEGVDKMEQTFEAAYSNYKEHEQFAGLAVHYYKDYKALESNRE